MARLKFEMFLDITVLNIEVFLRDLQMEKVVRLLVGGVVLQIALIMWI